MSYDRDQTLAVEYQRILNQSPWLKPVYGDLSRYQGTLQINGVPVQVEIILPDFYPVVKPNVYVLNNIHHPLLNHDKSVQLRFLDNWTPNHTVIDLIQALRVELGDGNLRASSDRAPSISSSQIRYPLHQQEPVSPPSRVQLVNEAEIKRVQAEINQIQEELRQIQSRIVRVQEQHLQSQGNVSSSIKVSLTDELQAKKIAVNELLEILEDKFEDGDLGDVEFFRLYKIYMKEKFIVEAQLATEGVIEGEKQHGISRTHEKREQVRS